MIFCAVWHGPFSPSLTLSLILVYGQDPSVSLKTRACGPLFSTEAQDSYVASTQEHHSFFFFLIFLLLFLVFFGLHPKHMEVPRLSVESKLQLPAYTTAIAKQDLSCVCDLHHSSRQCRILNPWSEARDRTHNLMVPSRIR